MLSRCILEHRCMCIYSLRLCTLLHFCKDCFHIRWRLYKIQLHIGIFVIDLVRIRILCINNEKAALDKSPRCEDILTCVAFKQSWSLSPLIVIRNSFSPLTLSSLPDGRSIAYSCGCLYIFFIYYFYNQICLCYDLCGLSASVCCISYWLLSHWNILLL